MRLIIRNSSSDSYSLLSGAVVVAAEADTEVNYSNWYNLTFDNTFWINVNNNNFAIGDGSLFYNYPESGDFVRGLVRDDLATRDSDGAVIIRNKAARAGWTYGAIPIEFGTSTIGSLYANNLDGSSKSGVSLKFYDANGSEVTTAGVAGANQTTIVKSVAEFEPPYDYEVIGGAMRIDQSITKPSDCRLWIIAVPDVPANLGGSKEMTAGLNLRYLAPDNEFKVDGRVSKFLKYDSNYHTNKLQFNFVHTAGLQVGVQIIIELYRQ